VARTWTTPLTEGAAYLRTEDYDWHSDKRRYAVVRNGRLVDISEQEAKDLLDLAGAGSRARVRQEIWEQREYPESRARGAGFVAGEI
jgi:hypothetical protein